MIKAVISSSLSVATATLLLMVLPVVHFPKAEFKQISLSYPPLLLLHLSRKMLKPFSCQLLKLLLSSRKSLKALLQFPSLPSTPALRLFLLAS